MKPLAAPKIDFSEFDFEDILTLSGNPDPVPDPELPPDEF